ncbi:caspase-7 isoform X3 [Hydra vulgaris]|uniref:Caspase-7 isoform X3 n=1 Tax=Hydra vulgaris TaxID=6087 RepID=A0ABM4BD64_HYDVU
MALASDSAISSSFRMFIAKLTDELTVSDLRKLKFLLKENLPAGVIEKINDAYMYMETLENKELITRNNFTFLKQSFSLIGRNDLERKINELVKNDQLGQSDKSVKIQTNNRELHQSCNDQSKPTGSLSVSPHGLPGSNDKNTIGKKTSESKMTSAVDRSQSVDISKNLYSQPQPTKKQLITPSFFMKAPKPTQLQPSENSFDLPIQETIRKDTQSSYMLNNNPVGICHIISNNFEKPIISEDNKELPHRKGTNKDVIELEKVFSWLNFKVEVYWDKDAKSILDIIKKPPTLNENQQAIDCFVCCILSHGFTDGVYGSDGIKLRFSDMQAAINGNSAKWLVEKPKLFFVQACQGDREEVEICVDSGTPVDQNNTNSNNITSLSENSDFCFSVAAVSGTVSWRHPNDGTWYIQTLCHILKEYAHSESLLDILTMLNSNIAEKKDIIKSSKVVAKQMSTIRVMTLRKRFLFKPKGKFIERAFTSMDQAGIEEDMNNMVLIEKQTVNL